MRASLVLAKQAAQLNRAAGRPALPALFFLTDPARTPDPAAIAARLPRGACIIYRHFGAADRRAVAAKLKRIAGARSLILLVAADPTLAHQIGADGVHWPERLLRRRRGPKHWLITAAAHSARALARAAQAGADAALLSPVFTSNSPSADRPLGARKAAALARRAGLPVIALGGVNAESARRLSGRGFAGLAAIEGLAEA